MLGQKCGRDRKRKPATAPMEAAPPPPRKEPKREVVESAKTYEEIRARLKG